MRETRTAQTSLFDVYAQHKFVRFFQGAVEFARLERDSHPGKSVLSEISDEYTPKRYKPYLNYWALRHLSVG
jgi:hypothetical protein